MGNLFSLGAGGMVDISVSTGDEKNHLQPGRVLQLNGYDDPRYVIVKNQGINADFAAHGARYLCVNLNNYAFKTSDAFNLKHITEKKDGYGIQMYITDETIGDIETADIWEKAEAAEKEREQQEAADAAAHKKTLADLPGQFPHLHTRADKPKLADQALAAKNLKIELAAAFPRVKFSVTSSSFSMGDSVDVRWTDGPTSDQVGPIADRYQQGSFDGMEDLYTYNTNAFHEVFGGSKYVIAQRDCSNLPYETAAADQAAPTEPPAPIDTDQVTTTEPAAPTDTDSGVTFGEYKSHPTITLPTGRKGFTFGLTKARAILDHIGEIKTFAASA